MLLNGHPSDLLLVTSGGPQGSVLGPILFIIFLNDIESGLTPTISKFVDDTKVGGKVLTKIVWKITQRDLNHIIEWLEKQQMSFNVDRCKVCTLGPENHHTFTTNRNPLQVMQREEDLRLTISSDFRHANHCKKALNKANTMLALKKRIFECTTPDMMLSCISPWLDLISNMQYISGLLITEGHCFTEEDSMAHQENYSNLQSPTLLGMTEATQCLCTGGNTPTSGYSLCLEVHGK